MNQTPTVAVKRMHAVIRCMLNKFVRVTQIRIRYASFLKVTDDTAITG